MSVHSTDVQIRAYIDNGYRLKVEVKDLGLYMDGFRATHSSRSESGWWVQPPARLANGKWLQMPEFNKSLPLWREIEEAVINTVNGAESGTGTDLDKRPSIEEVSRIFPDSEVIGPGEISI